MATNPGNQNTFKILMANPAARRIIVRGFKKAAKGAASAVKSSQGLPGSKASVSSDPLTKVIPLGNLAPQSVVESMAKPWAEKLAETGTGRSVLQAINTVSAEALRSPGPRGPGVTTAAEPIVTPVTDRPPVKFVPYRSSDDAVAVPTPPALKWPPDPNA